ncbi:MAG: hypothetical protein AAB229_00510 [Candidatus Hydrogenedentota bacterium]
MAGRIDAIDIILRATEIVTQAPVDPTEFVRADLAGIAEAEQPTLPAAAPTSTLAATAAPVEAGALSPGPAPPAALPGAVAAEFGIGRNLDVTSRGPSVVSAAQDAEARARALAAVEARALPEQVPAIVSPREPPLPPVVPAPVEEPLLSVVVPESGPEAQAARSIRLSSLAGLAMNDPRGPVPIGASLSPLIAPIVVEPLGAVAPAAAWTFGTGRREERAPGALERGFPPAEAGPTPPAGAPAIASGGVVNVQA